MTDRPAKTDQPKKSHRSWIALGAVVLVAGLYFGVTSFLFRRAPGDANAPPIVVVIERGWGLSHIAGELQRTGVVASRAGFLLLAKETGVGGRIQAGEYAFARGQTLAAVLDQLAHHRTLKHKFTVAPGVTAAQVAAKLAAAGLDPHGAATKLIADPAFAASLGVSAPTLEGYLYPETYVYERGDEAQAMLVRMVKQFFQVWNQRFAARAKSNGLTPPQIVTLASIIEKESGFPPERPRIARVFLNRLALGMRLQADPTVIYAAGERWRNKLTEADLRRENAYNTYAHAGLPPGPICSPGADAIEAVLAPAAGPWQYFVANGEGRHVFSVTLDEHHRAVQQFQR
jgi:UPF0755 protein